MAPGGTRCILSRCWLRNCGSWGAIGFSKESFPERPQKRIAKLTGKRRSMNRAARLARVAYTDAAQ
jgi:hypothetical protein